MKEAVARRPQAPEPAEPTVEPDPAPRSRSANSDRTFAVVPVGSGSNGDGRDEALRLLIAHLAGQLGINPDRIRVRLDTEAERKAGARSAGGVAEDGVVYLRSKGFDPASRAGRGLVAHEAAHVAQSLLPGAALQPVPALRVPAEIEAETFARTYATTRTGAPVKVPLSPAVAAADKDFGALVSTVAQSRSAEIARIVDLLSHGVFDWAVTDDDVFDVLQILAMVPVLTARAMAQAIGAKYRKRIFGNLDRRHCSKHRTEILAACWAAESEKEFRSGDYQILNALSLENLDPLEAVAVDHVVALSPKVQKAATADAKRAARVAEAQDFAKSEIAGSATEKGLQEAHGEEELQAARLKVKDASFDKLAERIRAKLDEWRVTDAEALDLLDSVAEQCLTVKDPTDKFQALANAIGPKALDALLAQISANGLYKSERRRKAFVYLAATRQPFKNQQIAEKLMSSPWWQFWDTVTSEEAFVAYLLVKSMPERARAAFLKARGGEKWTRVVDELPANIRELASFNFYQGGKGESDRQAILTELIDSRIWTAAEKERLDATIRMVRAAGEGEFVFAQSKAHRADKVPELQHLVAKYELYLEGKRETYKEKELTGHAWYQEGIFAKFAGAWRFLALLFGLRNIQLAGEKLAADVDLNDVEDYGGIPFTPDKVTQLAHGARFHDTTRKERKKASENKEIPLNVVRGEMRADGEVVVHAARLLIDQLALAGDTTVTAAPVGCTGLHFSAKYQPEVFKPRSLDASFDELTLSDVAIVKGDAITSINSLKLKKVSLRLANESFQDTKSQDGLGAMFKALVSPEHAAGVRLSFERMEMNGVATSGGFFVRSVEIDDLVVQAGGNAEAYLDALNGSAGHLEERIKKEEAAGKENPQEAKAHADAAARLRKQLEKTKAEIAKGQPHGSVVDIRSIKVAGLPGITDEPIELSDIHGQGTSVAAVVPLFADPTSIRNMVRGSEAAPTIRGKLPGEEQFTIDIGRIEAKKPLRLVGSLPTADKARKEFEEFVDANKTGRYKAGYQAVHDALKQRAADAAEYEELANRGVQNLTPAQAERFRYLRRTLTEFEERRATIVETLAMEGVTLDVSADGNPELIAERLSVTGIKTFTPDGRENLRIASVTGEGVSISAAFTGGLVNAKAWRRNLQRADFKAQKLTLKDIRKAGTDATIEEITFEGDNEAKGLEASFERGDEATGGAVIGVKSRKVTAKGVSVPAHAALLRAEKERIESIPVTERRPEEVKRLKTIVAMLADLERIEDARKKAEETATKTKSKKEKAAAQKKIAKSGQDLKDWQDRLVVEKLTIEHLDIAIGGLGDVLAEGYEFDRDAAEVSITGKGKDGHWFEKAEAEGIRNRTAKGDQLVADKIVAGPVGGKLKKTKTGFALEGFSVASLAVRGVSYVSGDTKVQAIGESQLLGVSIDATVDFSETQTDLNLSKVRIERIVADNFKYEDAKKFVTVISGELIGLEVTGMHVGLPKDRTAKKEIEGRVTLDAVKSLTLGAVARGYKVGATLNAAKPEGDAAHAVSVAFAKSGETTVALKGLAATADVRKLSTGNKVRVAWKNLGGTIVKNGDDYTVMGLTVGDLTLSRMNWEIGNKTIVINDQVTLKGIALDLEASLRPKKKGAGSKSTKDAAADKEEKGEEPKKELAKLLVKKLTVDKIDAKAVEITMPAVEEDKAKGIAFKPRKSFNLEEAVIQGLTVTGFDVLNRTGKVEVTRSVEVTNLKTEIGEIARNDFKTATASFKMFGKDAKEPGAGGRELSATLTGKDGTVIKLGRTDSVTLAEIRALGQREGKAGKEDTYGSADKVTLAGITAGDLIIKDDYVSISDIEIAGPVDILGVEWRVTGATKQLITMESANLPDLMRIGGIRADFRKVPTGKIVAGKEVTRSEMDKLTVTSVSVPKLAATKLHYKGPLESKMGKKTVELDFPTAVIEGIDIKNLEKDFGANLLKLDVKLKSASVAGFAATLTERLGTRAKTKKLGADIATGEIRADAILKTMNAGTPDKKTEIEDGAFELDSVGLRNVTGTLSKTRKKGKTIGSDTRFADKLLEGPGIDAKSIYVDKKGTTVGSVSVRGVTYRDPNIGLTLDVQELVVPQTTTIPKEGPITIPEATITNAFFRVDDLTALLKKRKKGGISGAKSSLDLEQFYRLLDHVNGNIKADVYAPIDLPQLGDMPVLGKRMLRQDVFPVDVTITDGKFNYKDVWSNAIWYSNDAIASLQMDTDDYKITTNGLSMTVEPDWSKSYLTLEVSGKNILTWTPADDAERAEMTAGNVQLKRIIRSNEMDTPAERKARKEAREAKKAAGERRNIHAEWIELRNVDANLCIKGKIPLDLGSTGMVTLGGEGENALTALTLNSDKEAPNNKLTWGLDAMAVTVHELNFGDTELKGINEKDGAEIHIQKVEGGSLQFSAGKVARPTALEGTVTKASVTNLAIERGE